ncbi:hypothetical protein [Kitasatospora sp. LaBMicrA B282]|uniref:hypothetical protein n=1 Tax=Kitasatospora sp. LaBMicrA B282 TaxID=3420949 RepID=UPI003D0B8CAF
MQRATFARWSSAVLGMAVTLTACAEGLPMKPAGAKVTEARASAVELMLGNARTGGALTQTTLMAVIIKYGGGFVTSVSASGTPGTVDSELQLDAVLGPGTVRSTVQGETILGPAAMRCYRFTAGYQDPAAGYRAIKCPAGLGADQAARLAARQWAVQEVASRYGMGGQGVARALPQTVEQAEQLLGVGPTGQYPAVLPPSTASALPQPRVTSTVTASPVPTATASPQPLTASAFAESAGLAALAVPQPDGGCVFVRFAPEPADEPHPGGLDTNGWAAPVDAACTGSAALATAGYATMDPNAGG